MKVATCQRDLFHLNMVYFIWPEGNSIKQMSVPELTNHNSRKAFIALEKEKKTLVSA